MDTGGNCEFCIGTVQKKSKSYFEIIGNKEKYNEMKQVAEKSKKDFFYSEIAKRAIGS